MQTKTTSELIINNAMTLFALNGYKNTSIRDIAKKVNIKESSIYNHFSSKSEIMEKIINCFISLDCSLSTENIIYKNTITKEDVREWINSISLFFDNKDIETSISLCKIITTERYYRPSLNEYLESVFARQSKSFATMLFKSCVARGVAVNEADLEKTSVLAVGSLMTYYDYFPSQKSHDKVFLIQNQTIDMIFYLVNHF